MPLFGLFGPPNVEKLKAKRDVQSLIKALNYKEDNDVRVAAAEALGQIGDVRAVEPLMAALKLRPMKQAAADALVRIGAAAVRPLLAAHVKSHPFLEDTYQEELESVLVRIGATDIDPLVAALKDSESDIRREAAILLGEIGDDRVVDPLVAALKDRRPSVRLAAANMLGKIADARAVDPLVAAIKDNPYIEGLGRGVAVAAVFALSRMGAAAVGPLVAILKDEDSKDEDSSVRAAAAQVLGNIGDARATEPLVATLKDSSSFVRQRAASALVSLGWQSADDAQRLLHAVAQQDWEQLIRSGAMAVEPLVVMLKDESRDVWEPAVEALGKVGDERAVEPLVAMATNNGWAAEAAISSLESVLERTKTEIASRDLRMIAGLENVFKLVARAGPVKHSAMAVEVPLDCSRVIQLARQELIRRGLEA